MASSWPKTSFPAVVRRWRYAASLLQMMVLDPSCCGDTAPAENDLVIHYRNYKAELTDEQYDKLFFKVRAVCNMEAYLVVYSVLAIRSKISVIIQ